MSMCTSPNTSSLSLVIKEGLSRVAARVAADGEESFSNSAVAAQQKGDSREINKSSWLIHCIENGLAGYAMTVCSRCVDYILGLGGGLLDQMRSTVRISYELQKSFHRDRGNSGIEERERFHLLYLHHRL